MPDRNLSLLLVVHFELETRFEPGDDFANAVDVDEKGTMHAPKDVRIEIRLQFLNGTVVQVSLDISRDDCDQSIVDGGVNPSLASATRFRIPLRTANLSASRLVHRELVPKPWIRQLA